MNRYLTILATTAVCAFAVTGMALAGTGQHEIINPGVAGATSPANFPDSCYLEADDLTNNQSIYIDCDNLNATVQVLTASDLGTAYTITADDSNKRLELSGNMDITLPDGGTATNIRVPFVIDTAPTGTETITISVPTGDNSVIYGPVGQLNLTDNIMYASSLAGDADTITFSSSSVLAGDHGELYNDANGIWHISGVLSFASALSREWPDQIEFSSSKASID